MDPGDSAAWTAAIVAIIAAVISAVTAIVAGLQANHAKRSADISEKALVESQAQTEAAQQAAQAAEAQVAEARRQNEITEKQLELARAQFQGDEQRQRHEQAQRHATNVHAVLLAAAEVRAEYASNAAEVVELQDRERAPYGLDPSLFLMGRAEQAWDEAVTALRRERPDAPAVTEAIHHYDEAAKDLSAAIDIASDHAQNRTLNAAKQQDLVAKADVLDARLTQLTRVCTAFFADLGIDPTKPLRE